MTLNILSFLKSIFLHVFFLHFDGSKICPKFMKKRRGNIIDVILMYNYFEQVLQLIVHLFRIQSNIYVRVFLRHLWNLFNTVSLESTFRGCFFNCLFLKIKLLFWDVKKAWNKVLRFHRISCSFSSRNIKSLI